MFFAAFHTGQKKLLENPPFKGEKLTVSALCAAVLSVTLVALYGDALSMVGGIFGNFGGWSVFSALPICLIQVYMLVFGCELLSGMKPLAKVLGWFGKYSIQILLAHAFVAMLVTMFTGWTNNLKIWRCF